MGIVSYIKNILRKKKRTARYGSGSYYSYSGNRSRLSPLSYFAKMEEKVLAFKADDAFLSHVPVKEVNRFMGLRNEKEILEAMGNPVIKTEHEDLGHIFVSLKYNISIYDYEVRLFFLLIDNHVSGFVYEFKEVFSQKNNKLELIYRSIFNNYLAGGSYKAEDFINKALESGCSIHDKEGNIISISSTVLLTLFYINDSERLKSIFASLRNKKDDNEREIEETRLNLLKENL